MFFENNNYNYDYDFDFDVLSLAGFDYGKSPKRFENTGKLVDSKEGFLRGNMFKNEYDPYKNMQYKMLKPKNEREVLLFKIMEIDFAINDLNLYLDMHPEDAEMYEKFKAYTNECIRLKDEYAKKYGPLTLEQTKSNEYEWMKNPWPWDKSGGSMYV